MGMSSGLIKRGAVPMKVAISASGRDRIVAARMDEEMDSQPREGDPY